MSDYLYTLDPEHWQKAILSISSERASDKMKILSLLLPDLLLDAGEKRIGKTEQDIKGTFTDMDNLLHVRIAMRDIHLATGWNTKTAGRVFKTLNNCGVVSYRTFYETWGGHKYNLSYVAALDNLWMARIYMPQGQERNRGYRQKNYKPRCYSCGSEAMKATGGIEYKCGRCGKTHVYYPSKDIE